MNKMIVTLFVGTLAVMAFGDVTPLPDAALWTGILEFIQKLTGGNLTLLVIGAALVQLGVVMFRTTFGRNLTGRWTLAVLYALNTVLAVLLGVSAGISIPEILGSSAVMSLLMNGFAELLKNILPQKA
jgi:hypothetical protein